MPLVRTMNTTDVDSARIQLTNGELSAPDEGLSASHEVSILDLLIVVARGKKLILWFAGVSAILALVVSLLLPQWYTAKTIILPPQQSSSLSSAVMNQLGNLAPLAAMAGRDLNLKNPSDLYVSLLKSRTVEDAMIQRFDLLSRYRKKRLTDARRKFESHREIEAGQKDGLIQISLEDKDPKRAAEMANAYVEELRRLSSGLAITEAAQRRAFFEGQLAQTKDNLAAAEEELKRTELQTGLIQLDSQARALIQTVAVLRAQITAKEVEIQSLRSAATEENPAIIAAQQELSALRSQLSKLGVRRGGGPDDILLPKGAVPEAGLEYVRKLRDVRYQEAIFEILARQLEMAKLDEAKQGSLIQVVDQAIVPDKRSFPKRTLIVLLSTIAGILLAVVWLFARESAARALEAPEERERLAMLRSHLTFRRSRAA